jgi:hypothetical protein
MALLLEQKQVYGIVMGEDKRPEDRAEDATTAEKLAHRAAVKDWVKQHGTARLTILLGIEPWLQASYMEITDARTLWEKLATGYKARLKFNVFQIRKELLGIRLEDCDDVDSYSLRINQKVKDYNLCSEPSTSSSDATRTLAKITNEEHQFYLLHGIPRNDDWQFFLELMMDKNGTATLTPDEIVIKLVENEATIKHENGLGQEAVLFAKGNTKGNSKGNAKGKGKSKGRKSWKGDESEEDQGDRKSQPTCFYCHKEAHKVSNCPSMKCGDPPVMKNGTETAAKNDTITAASVSEETIENYWVTGTNGKSAPLKECWYLDCASTSHICGDRRKFARYTGFAKKDVWEIRDFAGTVAGKTIGQGDVRLRFRLPGGRDRINELVVRDVLHVEGAHNSLSQSRLMDRGLWIVPVNGYGIKIYEAPAMGTGCGGQGSLVAMAPQIGGVFRFDVDARGQGRRSRDVSRDQRYTAPNATPNEHTYTYILELEEPTYMDVLDSEEQKTQDILVPITSKSTINRPAAGGKSGGNSAGQLRDRSGSSDENDDEDENEDEDEDNPPVVIDKSKKSSLTRELAGLDGNLASTWKVPAGSHRRRSWTDHCHRRSGRLEIESVEAD